MRLTKPINIAAVAVLCAASSLAVTKFSGITATGSATDHQVDHAATEQARKQRSLSTTDLHVNALQNGLEPGTAGFHLYRPWGVWPGDLMDDQFTGSPDWHFVKTITPFTQAFQNPRLDVIPMIPVSLEKPFSNAFATLAKHPLGNSEWEVRATFGTRALDVIRLSHGTSSSVTAYTDWYNIRHPNGGPSTEMTAVLVYRGVALLPFSVTSMISETTEQTVTVSEGHTEAEADAIIATFNAS